MLLVGGLGVHTRVVGRSAIRDYLHSELMRINVPIDSNRLQ